VFTLFNRPLPRADQPPLVTRQVVVTPTAPPVVTQLALPTVVRRPQTTMVIPTAGIFAPVIQVYLDGVSWDVSQLGANAGHLQGTPWFDAGGNIGLAGHVEMADGRPGIFAQIDRLKIGDPIEITDRGVLHRYAVRVVKKTSPDDLTVLYPTPTDRLTLITCGAYDFLQDAYQERVVVVAEPA
jgi:LPXTG-site transpeptidase (sortase) family protein